MDITGMQPLLSAVLRRSNRTPSKKGEKGRIIETVHCSNPSCESQQLKKFVHFVMPEGMNIEGLSEATLEKFLNLGYLQTFHDIYHLDQHREEIIRLEGFGEKSFDRLWNAIQASRSTTFVRYLSAWIFHGRPYKKPGYWIPYSPAV